MQKQLLLLWAILLLLVSLLFISVENHKKLLSIQEKQKILETQSQIAEMGIQEKLVSIQAQLDSWECSE